MANLAILSIQQPLNFNNEATHIQHCEQIAIATEQPFGGGVTMVEDSEAADEVARPGILWFRARVGVKGLVGFRGPL